MQQAKSSTSYQVLARKYRPDRFERLIGQDSMLRVLEGAFKTGRIAHAFLFSGIRGVGKTSVARLLARALNYSRPGVDNPVMELDPPGRHCAAIAEGRHPDVVEIDAASHNGVAEIRDLIEKAHYHTMEARYKIFIVDEVHMLSNAAFNALLKTLEEPPDSVVFLFATTELHKVPVTIRSRCQCFHLRRVEREQLKVFLQEVLHAEGMKADDPEALDLIAGAAEGSVRDALSILDQAVVYALADAEPVTLAGVRRLLGLSATQSRWRLLEAIFSAKTQEALDMFDAMYAEGHAPSAILRQLLESMHLVAIADGAQTRATEGTMTESDRQPARALRARLDMRAVMHGWEILRHALEELRWGMDARAGAHMAILRLAHFRDLPSVDEALEGVEKLLQKTEAVQKNEKALAQGRVKKNSP